jgi:hypothetical protein
VFTPDLLHCAFVHLPCDDRGVFVDPGRNALYDCNALGVRWKSLTARQKELQNLIDKAKESAAACGCVLELFCSSRIGLINYLLDLAEVTDVALGDIVGTSRFGATAAVTVLNIGGMNDNVPAKAPFLSTLGGCESIIATVTVVVLGLNRRHSRQKLNL